jgi:hypothetical protein
VQLGDLGARTWLAAGVDRGLPGVGSHGQDRGADALVGRQADREPHAALAQVVDQGMGGAAGVGADQQRLVAGGLGELRERQIYHLDVVGGAFGAGVARPQDPSQGLAGPIAAVQEGDQRVETEAALGRSQPRLACRSGRPAACRPHPPPAGPRRARPPARPPLWRGHAQRAGRQARRDHKRPAQPPSTPLAWRQPGRIAQAGCAGRQDRSSSRRRRPAAPPDLVGPSPRHGGAGWSGCGPPASPTRGST